MHILWCQFQPNYGNQEDGYTHHFNHLSKKDWVSLRQIRNLDRGIVKCGERFYQFRRVVYPFTNAKEQNTQKQHEDIAVTQELNLGRQCDNHACSANRDECFPWPIYAEPREGVTHFEFLSKDQQLPRRAGKSRAMLTKLITFQLPVDEFGRWVLFVFVNKNLA